MISIDEFEQKFGIKVGDGLSPPEEAEEPSEAAAPSG
jgi:hypothetical protein